MKSKFILNWELPPIWLRSFIAVLLLLGVFFRFANLDHRFYWGDEVYTSIRISGYTTAELVHQVFDGQLHSIEDLQKYQRINSEKGAFNTIQG